MGTLHRSSDGHRVQLGVRVLVGRSRGCTLCLQEETVSAEHAVLWWHDGWRVRDLGSTNGTFVNGERLPVGAERGVDVDDAIGFGTPEEPFVLSEAAAPGASAVREGDGFVVHCQGELLAIPNPDDPEVTVHAGRDGRWVVEQGGHPRVAEDGAEVLLGEVTWTLALPTVLPSTVRDSPTAGLDEIGLRFVVSRDEEVVTITVELPGGARPLPARVFHYMLLTLARARASDQQPDEAARGWVHVADLARGLRLSESMVNVHVWRARNQLQALGVRGAGDLVVRQGRSGLLRLGVQRLSIVQSS